MTQGISIHSLSTLQLPLANRFYRHCRYSAKAGRDEQVYIARQNGEIVAAVRLIEKPQGHCFMRSFCVEPTRRRFGIGQSLLEGIVPALQSYYSYCFPFIELQDFYGSIGFCTVEPSTLPSFVVEPYRRYRQQGRNIAIMIRPPQDI